MRYIESTEVARGSVRSWGSAVSWTGNYKTDSASVRDSCVRISGGKYLGRENSTAGNSVDPLYCKVPAARETHYSRLSVSRIA